jgi:hypothetical protein
MPNIGEHAVVLGASMGGLLAARVLADFHHTVTVVERYVLPVDIANRRGVVDWTKPVACFEEALALIRALWGCGGDLVSRDSPYFPVHNAVFDLPPYRGKWPEIWVAAHGPRMPGATVRYADGWLPGIAKRTSEYHQRLEAVRTAASNAGRDPMSVAPAAWVFVMTGRTADDVDEALNSDIAKSCALNVSAEFWACHGVRHPLGEDFSGAQDPVPQTVDEPPVPSYTAQVPVSLLKEAFFDWDSRRSHRPSSTLARSRCALHRRVQHQHATTKPAQRFSSDHSLDQHPVWTQKVVNHTVVITRTLKGRNQTMSENGHAVDALAVTANIRPRKVRNP